MSGIAGIVNLDGEPIDCRLLTGMMEEIAFRGPDARNTWAGEGACLGHTLLRTTNESRDEHQPLSLDGKVWIVADARIDAREELAAVLRAYGQDVDVAVPDVELILFAWSVWRENCVEHLLGDFAFAIWDARERRLFCARDQMGVRQLYYAQVGQTVIFSNTLNCIRRHPGVSCRLNDLAIADFLLFDANQDPSATAFADIQRIPSAHSAMWGENGLQFRTYWTFPIDDPVFYSRQQDYVVHFRELLRTAVGDRLRVGRVGVLMSGGLDSSSLAATALDLVRNRSANDAVRAFTVAHPHDLERHYAEMVATGLGIPIEFDDNVAGIDPAWYRQSLHTPEPMPWPNSLAWDRAYHQHIASHSRVLFYGEGPDNALCYEWRPYVSHLFRRRCFGRIIHDLFSHVLIHRQIPIRALLQPLMPNRHKDYPQPIYPEWLNRDFENRFQLRARWETFRSAAAIVDSHPVRPDGYRSLALRSWQQLFNGFDAENTQACLEVRHPFLDLRLLRYLLRVPALPWCRSKYLIRRSMQGILPAPVLRRPKSPLFRNFWNERVVECGMPPFESAQSLESYIDADRVHWRPESGEKHFWVNFRVRSLGFWLRNLNC